MDSPTRILVIDDEEAICFAFKRYFEMRGIRVEAAPTGAAGLEAYRREPADLVFLDVRLPDRSGLEVLEELLEEDPRARVVVITAHGSLETVAGAIRGKAFDYLAKPIDLDESAELLERALAASKVRSGEAGAHAGPAGQAGAILVGQSAAIQDVYKRIGRVAESGATVLLLGQTGTGKELVARAIHEYSRRRGAPFVAVNCGALPEPLLESELFGYARGAFTGADADKPGRFESADSGTLLLDEVGELSPAAQVKLLRFLDTQTVERLGSVRPIRLDVRIIAATNRDLADDVRQRRFRQDLYYRLAVIQIELPPLAARRDDILPLAAHFLAQRAPQGGSPPPISVSAARLLRAYPWPGNVRELRNAMEHATAVSGGGPILPAHLPEAVREGRAGVHAGAEADPDAILGRFADSLGEGVPYAEAVRRLEKVLLGRAMERAGGNQSAAAQALGLHRNTLRKKLRELGLEG